MRGKASIQQKWLVSSFGMKRLLSLIIFCFSLAWSHSQTRVNTEIDTSRIRIGEQVRYKITVEADSSAVVFFPEGQTFSPMETVEAFLTDTTKRQNRMLLQKTYALTQFDSGSYTIPPQRIEIDGKGYLTDSARVDVGTVPVDTVAQPMFDIKPLIEVEKNYAGVWKVLLWILLILAVTGFLIYFLFIKKKKLSEEEKEALLPAYDRALLELKRLENSKYLIQDEYKRYYSELTDIVRSYLEEDANISALESTTNQLIEKLELLKDAGELKLNQDTIRQFQMILQTADLVKFARSKPPTTQAENDRQAVEQLVIKTKEALPEPTEEELMQQQEYLEEIARKRRKKNIIKLAAAAVLVLLAATAGFTAYYGPKYVWDTVTRDPSKKMLEGEWVKSIYGYPPILIETPEVLVRQSSPAQLQDSEKLKELYHFVYENEDGLFTVGATSKTLSEPVEPDYEQSLEQVLVYLESKGARNIITKQEEFTTVSGVKGVKVYGSGTFKEPGSNDRIKGQYMLLMFGGNGFQQQLLLSWADEDNYAEEIIGRILSSFDVKTQT
ncbi:MAG: BatD family protein [Flavobacteriaceae bacterium]